MIEGWKQEMEAEYLAFLQEWPGATPHEFAVQFGRSERAVKTLVLAWGFLLRLCLLGTIGLAACWMVTSLLP